MEVYHWVVCCMLFTTVASFSILDAIPGYTNNSLAEVEYSRDCRCENGRCVTDNRGNTKCACRPGYALQEEFNCQPCDCGSLGKCIFILQLVGGSSQKSKENYKYQKKCVCDVGSAEKDGVCIDCYCGENSACDFDYGMKRCYCIEGYSEKDGVCTRCDCGFYGKCEFDRGIKKCQCDEGYLVLNGRCEECNCGDHGVCSFVNGVKTCQCQRGYSVNNGRCDACDCGENSEECSFVNGAKKCRCKDRFADRYGVCEDCDCGQFGYACSFDNNVKTCHCVEGYVQKRDRCEVGCSARNPCQNGGYCKEGFCFCLRGTRGEFCEVIDECAYLCPRQNDINCTYDVGQQKAYCKCLDNNFRYNPNVKQCRYPCEDRRPCRNGGSCVSTGSDAFCRCLEGTSGDFCEQVPDCDRKNCGSDARCLYDPRRQRAICVCSDRGLTFDSATLQCKKTCDGAGACKNGGVCEPSELGNFCRCPDGTVGDFCEQIPGCNNLDCGREALCKYDVRERRAACTCNDGNLSFDPKDKKCKETCVDDRTCKNHGKCEGSSYLRFCDCPEGTTGQFCEEVPECNLIDCGPDADCVYNAETKRADCACKDANLKFDTQSSSCKKSCDEYQTLCANGGQCVNRFCDCLNGTAGDLCDIVPECNTKNCGKDADCVYSQERRSAACLCRDGRYSFDEVDLRCKKSCNADDECFNGGQCIFKGASKFCDCPPGTKGDTCEIVEDCVTGRVKCKDNAYCVFDVERQKAVCACAGEGRRYDSLSEKCKLTCYEDASCHNGGQCLHRGDSLFCHCKPGTSGDLCEVVEDCVQGLCGNSDGVRCLYDVNREAGVCQCKNAEHQYVPESKMCKACDCGPNTVSCKYTNGNKVCTCRDGFADKNGICRKTRCVEKRCQNGKCVVNNDEQEVCSCYEGYELEGDYCRRLNCTKTPCTNGTCIVRRGNIEQCVCPDGHSLHSGVCLRGACRVDTCFGGFCKTIEGELMCVCPKGYSLQGIGCFATVCKHQPCYGGYCYVREEDKEEICVCPKTHYLENNVCKRKICRTPCYGGDCQLTNEGGEICVCPSGLTLVEGVCRAN